MEEAVSRVMPGNTVDGIFTVEDAAKTVRFFAQFSGALIGQASRDAAGNPLVAMTNASR